MSSTYTHDKSVIEQISVDASILTRNPVYEGTSRSFLFASEGSVVIIFDYETAQHFASITMTTLRERDFEQFQNAEQ